MQKKPTVNIIGYGKVGQTLAKLFESTDTVKMGGVVASRHAPHSLDTLLSADIYLITTPDDVIMNTCKKLIATTNFHEGSIIVHCSGVLSSDVLKFDSQKKYYSVSVHPIKSFASVENAVSTFQGTLCAIEGDPAAIELITRIFTQIGGNVFQIEANKKPLYHAACAIANNYLTTLHAEAYSCFIAGGVEKTIAKKATTQLMQEALDNLKNHNHKTALTGPIKRGDNNTVQLHINALSALPHIQELYLLFLKLTKKLISE